MSQHIHFETELKPALRDDSNGITERKETTLFIQKPVLYILSIYSYCITPSRGLESTLFASKNKFPTTCIGSDQTMSVAYVHKGGGGGGGGCYSDISAT